MLLKVGEFVFENFVKFAYFLEASMRNEEEQRYFDEFYEEVYVELERKYGTVDELNVCENIGEHMIGNVYVKFAREEDAEKAVKDLENRWYVKNSIFKTNLIFRFNGEAIYPELSPVTDFRESRCRQYDLTSCNKGGFCNFMHLKQVSEPMLRRLQRNRRTWQRSERFDNYAREYNRNRDDGRDFDDRGGRGGGGGRRDRYGQDRDYDRGDRRRDRY